MPPTAAPPEIQAERRCARRAAVLKSAILVYGPENSTLNCNILNLSENGAKVRAPGLPEAADVMQLRRSDGTTHGCWPIWRNGQNIGLEFVTQPASEDDASQERRDRSRETTVRPGQIVFKDGHCVIDCTISNLSKTGASLQPQDLVSCPDMFELRIKNGPIRFCEIVRRDGEIIGVKFLDLEES